MTDNFNKDNHFDWLNDNNDNKENFSNINPTSLNQESKDSFEETRAHDFNFQANNFKEENTFKEENKEERTIDDGLKAYIEKELKKTKRFAFAKGLALVLVGSLLGSLITANFPKNSEKVLKNPSNPEAVNISAKEEYNIESAVAKKATPSVVGVQVNVQRRVGFFDDQVIQGQAIGSGVIVSQDGYILTNAHVVSDAKDDQQVDVLFSDNSTAKAKILFRDETLDLAIIKVEKTGLQAIELGDSDHVQVGDKAIAIGNPVGLNLQSTLTSGYISGVNRSIQMQDSSVLDGLFQTDAAINSGNSGGALLNKDGKLIGINTAKVQSTDGIGFAIPVNTAKPIIKSFLEKGRFESVQLGIRGVNIDVYQQYLGSEEDLSGVKGVVVVDIARGGNASKSDLRENDIILSINDKPIESMNKLKQVLLTISEGDTAKVKIRRQGQEKEIEIKFDGQTPNV